MSKTINCNSSNDGADINTQYMEHTSDMYLDMTTFVASNIIFEYHVKMYNS